MTKLALVPAAEESPEDALARLLPRLADFERDAADVRREIDIERQRLARKRGVAFIRFEVVRAEFG